MTKTCKSCGATEDVCYSMVFNEHLCIECLFMFTPVLDTLQVKDIDAEIAVRARTSVSEQYAAYVESFPINDPRD